MTWEIEMTKRMAGQLYPQLRPFLAGHQEGTHGGMVPVYKVKAWHRPNEDGTYRPYVEPNLWAADVHRFRLVRGALWDFAPVPFAHPVPSPAEHAALLCEIGQDVADCLLGLPSRSPPTASEQDALHQRAECLIRPPLMESDKRPVFWRDVKTGVRGFFRLPGRSK